jgi:integrase
MVRYYGPDGSYKFARLGTADDHQDVNGHDVLDFKAAQQSAMEKATEAGRKDSNKDIHLGPYTVSDALDDYLVKYKADGKALKATQTAIDAHIRSSLGRREVEALTTKHVRTWMQALAEAPRRLRTRKGDATQSAPLDSTDPEALRKRKATANRVLTILKAALNFAHHEGRVRSSEWRKVKPFGNVDAPRIRYLSAAEAKRLINAADPDFRKLVQAALLTGCRYGELVRLEIGDYNPDAKAIHVRESKSGKPRHIPLTEEGAKFFAGLTAGHPGGHRLLTHDGLPWGEGHQKRRMTDACKRAAIAPAISFHDLRHTYASLLAMNGVALQVIARALGHADTRMTERHYAHLSPDHVAEQIRANLPSFGIKDGKVRAIR